MKITRIVISVISVLTAGVVIAAATTDMHIGCGIYTVDQLRPEAETAILEFRVDRMSGRSISVKHLGSEEAAGRSRFRTRAGTLGGTAKCGSVAESNAHYVIEPIGPSFKAEFRGARPARVVIREGGVELASGTLNASGDATIELTW